jgi:hypothetical protein
VLGSGDASFSLADGSALIAVDTTTGCRSEPRIGDRVDYLSIPSGRLEVRAFPYADVFLGNRKLGTTPFQPIELPAGRCSVRAVSDGVEKTTEVLVEVGRTSRATFTFP